MCSARIPALEGVETHYRISVAHDPGWEYETGLDIFNWLDKFLRLQEVPRPLAIVLDEYDALFAKSKDLPDIEDAIKDMGGAKWDKLALVPVLTSVPSTPEGDYSP